MRSRRAILFCAVALAAAGCQRGTQSCSVSGTVSYRGHDVEEGEIIFADASQQVATAAGTITRGTYRVKMLPGNKTVRITASKPTGRILTGAMGVELPQRVELIPARYNTASRLGCTVEPQREMVVDFALD